MRALLAIMLLSFAGCALDFDSLTSGNGKGDTNQTGLAVSLPAPTGSSVAGFIVDVYGPGAISCDFAPEDLPIKSVLIALSSINLPNGNVVPAIGHKFADKFFVLAAGSYCVEAIPVDSSEIRVGACSVAQGGPYSVLSSQTNEIMLVSNCTRPDAGGLGTTVTVNNDPAITELIFDRGQTIDTCETLHITAIANDPDNNPLTFDWEVSEKPGSDADFEVTSVGNILTFRSFIAGDYKVNLAVCDSLNVCASLSFPLYVAGIDCRPLPPPIPDSDAGG